MFQFLLSFMGQTRLTRLIAAGIASSCPGRRNAPRAFSLPDRADRTGGFIRAQGAGRHGPRPRPREGTAPHDIRPVPTGSGHCRGRRRSRTARRLRHAAAPAAAAAAAASAAGASRPSPIARSRPAARTMRWCCRRSARTAAASRSTPASMRTARCGTSARRWNVAALNCLDAAEAAADPRWLRTFLTKYQRKLTAANTAIDARFRREHGSRNDAIKAREAFMTQVYNYFALPPARADFCNVALQVANEFLPPSPRTPKAVRRRRAAALRDGVPDRSSASYEQYQVDSGGLGRALRRALRRLAAGLRRGARARAAERRRRAWRPQRAGAGRRSDRSRNRRADSGHPGARGRPLRRRWCSRCRRAGPPTSALTAHISPSKRAAFSLGSALFAGAPLAQTPERGRSSAGRARRSQ